MGIDGFANVYTLMAQSISRIKHTNNKNIRELVIIKSEWSRENGKLKTND